MTSQVLGVTIATMNVNAEIITTGTELLLGELVDTNSSYIARRLRTIGVNLFYITSVGDNEQRMVNILTQALQRSDVIITTGGLGPTVDDVTREAVARATGRRLVLHEDLLRQIEARFARWGRRMTENNRRQAYLPEGAIPIENPVGTAPCFIVQEGRASIISLPGVPREMEYLMEHKVMPYLRDKFDLHQVIKAKVLKTCAIGESTIDDRIKELMTSQNPTVGLAAHPAQTDVRITARAPSEEEADRLIADMEAKIRALLGDVIYGVDKERLEDVVAGLMKASGVSLSLLETVTRGSVARRLSSALGAEAPAHLKRQQVLDASPETARAQLAEILGLSSGSAPELETDGHKWASRIAQTVREQDASDMALAIVGLQSVDEKSYEPVWGSIWCALATPDGAVVRTFRFGGENDTLIPWISGMSLDILRRALLGLNQQPDY